MYIVLNSLLEIYQKPLSLGHLAYIYIYIKDKIVGPNGVPYI